MPAHFADLRLSTRRHSHTGGTTARARYRFSRKAGTQLPRSNAILRTAWIWSSQELVELVTDDRLRSPYRKAWRTLYLLLLSASERHQRTCAVHRRHSVRSGRRRCQRQRVKPSRSAGTAGAPPRRKPPPEWQGSWEKSSEGLFTGCPPLSPLTSPTLSPSTGGCIPLATSRES